ncbi:MAG TPA: PorV/PorQ family protein [Candidatus Goldiibacteriota bacterium]|nr:PorV/PorQ family protein [Candidatus Goldiibacteriota bacterium]
MAKNSRLNRVALLAAAAFMVASTAVYPLGGGTTNADFLKIGVGARPSAMGGAFTSVADDSNASFWNPAGIAGIPQWNITVMHMLWYANSGYEYLSVVMPVDSMTSVGLSANMLWIPPFDSTADAGNPFALNLGDTAMSYDLAVTVSAARILGNLYTSDFTIGNIAAGINLTYIGRKVLDEQLPASFSVDLGIIANITEDIRAALVLCDMGTATGDDPSPFAARLGVSSKFSFSKDATVLLAMDLTKPVDLSNSEYSAWMFNAGLEAALFKTAYIRAGYKFGQEDEGFTVGGGFGIPGLLNADYAFAPHAELGGSHRMSLTLAFGQESPRPVIGAPRPPQKVTAIAGDKVVSVGWDPNPEANILGYNIYYKKQGDKKYTKLNTEPVMEESKFRTLLNNDITYDFVVTAINNRKLESIYSDVVSATPQKYTAKKPAAVKSPMAKIDEKNIVVMWEESQETFVAGYNLYYKKPGDTSFKKLNRAILRESRATLAGLKGKIRYTFTVTAVSKDGLESDYSDPVSAELPEEEYY